MAQQLPPSPRLSSCSSIIASRLEALQLQLDEERRRRMAVEQEISSFPSSKTPQTSDQPSLVRLTSAALKNSVPQPPSADDAVSARSTAAAPSSSRAPLPSESFPTSAGRTASATRRASASITRPDPYANTPKRLKDPLPPQAKGCAASPHLFGRRKVSNVDVYLSQTRHEQRMQALHQFQLPDS